MIPAQPTAEALARSTLPRGVQRGSTRVSVAREGLEKVLVNELGHRLAQRLAGSDIETEMNSAPDHAVLRLARRCRKTGEGVCHALQILGRHAESDVVRAGGMGEYRRRCAADGSVPGYVRSSGSMLGRRACDRRLRSRGGRDLGVDEPDRGCKYTRCTFHVSCGPARHGDSPCKLRTVPVQGQCGWPREKTLAAARAGTAVMQGSYGTDHGGLPVIRASTAGRLTTRRMPGTSRVQSPNANDLDRPDPEIIPANLGDSGFFREGNGGGSTSHCFWKILVNKIA